MQWPKHMDVTRRMRRIAGRRFRVAVYDVLTPLCAVFVLVLVAIGMPAAIKAARGDGQPGTFTAERQQCSPRTARGGGVCSWYGAFVSADGSVRVEDVLLDANTPRHVGDTVPVLYQGQLDPPKVYLAEGSVDWRLGGLIMLGSAGYLARKGWRLVRRARRRRRTLGARR